MLTKEKVIRVVNALPENFSLNELLERMILLDKVETGLRQVKEGKILTTEELRQKINDSKNKK